MALKLSEATRASICNPSAEEIRQTQQDAYRLLLRCGLLRVRLAPLATLRRCTYSRK